MKPFPPELLRAYPPAPARRRPFDNRPWWSRTPMLNTFERADGAVVGPGFTDIPNQPHVDWKWGRGDGESVRDHVVLADREFPLPHPGVRVGQTWALVWETPGLEASSTLYRTGESVFTITEYDADHIEYAQDPHGRLCLVEREIHKPWRTGGGWITDEELRDLCNDAFLLADVCCPHLAPWAPAEKEAKSK